MNLLMQNKAISSNNDSKRKIKRLFWDIETAPCVALVWGAGFGLNISHENIIVERRIICIAYKWEGERKRTVLRWDKNQDDRSMLIKFMAVANQADELVAHYGNHFDLPWFRTRVLFHRLPPIPIYKTVDTKALASKYFYFNSNKLDYISSFLGHGRKLHTDFELWKKIVMNNDQKALNYMCKYCGIDVDRLEKVYHDLMKFAPVRTHVGVLANGEKWTCPRTGSKNVFKDKTRVTANGTIQHQMRCNDNGAYYTISDSAFNQYKQWKLKQQKKIG